MVSFAIIEVDDGYTVIQVAPGQSPEDAALSEGGALVDPGPYDSYEDANDALDQFEAADEDEETIS
jgi:hypothetical protein